MCGSRLELFAFLLYVSFVTAAVLCGAFRLERWKAIAVANELALMGRELKADLLGQHAPLPRVHVPPLQGSPLPTRIDVGLHDLEEGADADERRGLLGFGAGMEEEAIELGVGVAQGRVVFHKLRAEAIRRGMAPFLSTCTLFAKCATAQLLSTCTLSDTDRLVGLPPGPATQRPTT